MNLIYLHMPYYPWEPIDLSERTLVPYDRVSNSKGLRGDWVIGASVIIYIGFVLLNRAGFWHSELNSCDFDQSSDTIPHESTGQISLPIYPITASKDKDSLLKIL